MEQGISIIIPTKGRFDYVKEMVLSLVLAVKHSHEPVQIIIVDASSEKEAEHIKILCEENCIDYFHLVESASEARNFGIKQAKFPIILFVDSDCKVDLKIFEEHLKGYNNINIGGCAGITEFVGEKTTASTMTEMMPFMNPFNSAKNVEYVGWGPTSNISFRRDILNKVNGFSSFLPPKEGGEDVDLGYRIQQLGYKIKCNPNAIVYHSRNALRGWRGLLERSFRWGRAESYLLSSHPNHTFLDIPKSPLFFWSFFVITFIVSFITHSFILILIPFLFVFLFTFFLTIFTFLQVSNKNSKKCFIYMFISIIMNFIYETGLIFECIYRRKINLMFYSFIYEQKQFYDRWYEGKIKTWSYVISFLILFVILAYLF